VDGNLYLGQTRGAWDLHSPTGTPVPGAEYVGYAGNGVFTQTGGKAHRRGPLYVGYARTPTNHPWPAGSWSRAT